PSSRRRASRTTSCRSWAPAPSNCPARASSGGNQVKRAFASLMALLLALPAAAQSYPSRPVRVIVPYQAGQGTDVAARYFAERLSKALGQQFIVDNRPGAGGNIGTEAVAHVTPDGYTLLMGTNATQTMNEFLYP